MSAVPALRDHDLESFAASSPLGILPAGLAAQLETARQVIEARFVTAGDMLSRIVDGVGALVAVLETVAGSLSPELIAETKADLGSAASALSSLPPRSDQRQASIATLCSCHQKLSEHVTEMRGGLRYLKCLALNLKMAAGGIAEAQEEFGLFVKDIEDNIKTAQQELEAIETGLFALRSQLDSAKGSCAALGSKIHLSVPSAAKAILDSAGTAAHQQAATRTLAEAAADLARQMRKQAGRVLAALQIGDITRQRIEHVQSALQQIESTHGAFDARDLDALGGLIGCQLRSSGEDFRRDIFEIYDNMSALTKDAGELLALRGRVQGERGDGILHQLQLRLGDAKALADQIESAEATAEETGSRAADAADRLATHVSAIQDIKAEVNLMALNAAIKCARLGDPGRPLNVIAVELRSHGLIIDDMAASTLEVLSEFTQAAHILCGDRDEHDPRISATMAMTTAAERIDAAGRRTQQDLEAFGGQSEALAEAMHRSVAQLGFEAEIGDIIDRVANACGAPGRQQPIEAAALGATAQAIIQALESSYTMARERDVHAAIIISSAEAEAPAADSSDDDLLF